MIITRGVGIPNALLNEPTTFLYLSTLVSAKDNNKTKKAISNVAISANVAIHKGAPGLHFSQGGSFSSSSASDESSAITDHQFYPPSAFARRALGLK